jgi:DNA repair protein RadC
MSRRIFARYQAGTVTRQLAEAGWLLDLPLYDHVVIAGDKYVSFATAGLL